MGQVGGAGDEIVGQGLEWIRIRRGNGKPEEVTRCREQLPGALNTGGLVRCTAGPWRRIRNPAGTCGTVGVGFGGSIFGNIRIAQVVHDAESAGLRPEMRTTPERGSRPNPACHSVKFRPRAASAKTRV